MIFCIGDGKSKSQGKGYQKNLQVFNKDVSEEEYKKWKGFLDVKNFKLPIAKWIDIKDIENPSTTQEQMGGYLKELNYEDAWKEMWKGLSSEDKKFFTTFLNFDKDIFKEITGIEVETPKVEDIIELNGVKYKKID